MRGTFQDCPSQDQQTKPVDRKQKTLRHTKIKGSPFPRHRPTIVFDNVIRGLPWTFISNAWHLHRHYMNIYTCLCYQQQLCKTGCCDTPASCWHKHLGLNQNNSDLTHDVIQWSPILVLESYRMCRFLFQSSTKTPDSIHQGLDDLLDQVGHFWARTKACSRPRVGDHWFRESVEQGYPPPVLDGSNVYGSLP